MHILYQILWETKPKLFSQHFTVLRYTHHFKQFHQTHLETIFFAAQNHPSPLFPPALCHESVNERNWSNLVSHQDF